MNVNFKILWFEDQVLWRPAPTREIKRILEQHNLEADITWRLGNEPDVQEKLKEDYDLIIMDFELLGVMGNTLIDDVRKHEIYTDVLFYSGEYRNMINTLFGIDEGGKLINEELNVVDGIFFADRKREELFPKMQKIIDMIVRRVQDVVNLRGVVLDNVSGFEAQMQNILTLAVNKFTENQIKTLNNYIKNKIVTSLKEEHQEKLKRIEASDQVLSEIISVPDYIIDSYKKARIVGRVLKVLKSQYNVIFDDKYNNFADLYNNNIIKYRNSLSHAMKSCENNKEVYIGEIDKRPIVFNEDLFRMLRGNILEYQKVIDDLEKGFENI